MNLKRICSILAATLLALPPALVAQCIVPANGAVVKTTSYTAVAADTGKLIVMNCAAPCTLTLPSTPQSPVWAIWTTSIGAGVASVSPNGLQLDGNTATVPIPPGVGEGFSIWTDNSNYFATGISQTFYVAGGGTAQAQTAGPIPGIAAYSDGLFLCYKPSTSNTGSGPTLAINGLAATTITKFGGAALVAGDLVNGVIACLEYNSTTPRFELQNPQSNQVIRRSCDIAVGDTSAAALLNAQLGPQKRLCYVPAAATVVEVDVAADAGTPNVIVAKNHAGTVSNLVSAALATAASGGIACSNTGGTTGLDGATTCFGTLQNTSLALGDYIELVSGTAGGTAKLMTIHVIYTVN